VSAASYYLRASEVETGIDELALHLQNASRVNPGSSSRRALRKLFEEPWVLDLFERLTKEERLRV
jgi:hypothetical protein